MSKRARHMVHLVNVNDHGQHRVATLGDLCTLDSTVPVLGNISRTRARIERGVCAQCRNRHNGCDRCLYENL